MPPAMSSTSFRRNRSLLEGLLPLFEKDEEDGEPPVKKRLNKFYFRDILRRNVINERHQGILKTNLELQECELALNPSQLEGYKKLIFVHNFRKMCSTCEIQNNTKLEKRTGWVLLQDFLK